jgi:hypothetical protein
MWVNFQDSIQLQVSDGEQVKCRKKLLGMRNFVVKKLVIKPQTKCSFAYGYVWLKIKFMLVYAQLHNATISLAVTTKLESETRTNAASQFVFTYR